MNMYKFFALILLLSVFLAMILCLISMLFLRTYIIGKIERRLRTKLQFTIPISRFNPLFGGAIEVALFVTVKYLQAKFYKKPLPPFKYYNFDSFALNHVGYNIAEASATEIFFSLSFVLGGGWFLVGGLFGLLFLHK